MNEKVFDKIMFDVKNSENAVLDLTDAGHIVNRPSSGDNLVEYDKDMLSKIPKFDQSKAHTILLTFSDSVVGNKITTNFLQRIKKCEKVINIINKYLENSLVKVLLLERKSNSIIILQCAIVPSFSSKENLTAKTIVEMSHQFSDIFCEAGFVTIREKIYSNVSFIDDIEFAELTSDIIKKNRYYEYTIELGEIKDESVLSGRIIECSNYLETCVSKSIPIYSSEPTMYINYAIRNVDKQSGIEKLSHVCNKLKEKQIVAKSTEIKYVWYDTYPVADDGWISPDSTNFGSAKKLSQFSLFGIPILPILIGSVLVGAFVTSKKK